MGVWHKSICLTNFLFSLPLGGSVLNAGRYSVAELDDYVDNAGQVITGRRKTA